MENWGAWRAMENASAHQPFEVLAFDFSEGDRRGRRNEMKKEESWEVLINEQVTKQT